MANGELTNILVSTDVTRYIEFKQMAGSYVQQGQGSRATVAKVPSDAGEALRSPLMGLFEKRRARNFLNWVGNFKEEDPKTHNGMNLAQTTMRQVYDKFGLEESTRDFIGHSMALFASDEYVDSKGMAKDCVERIRLYVNSMARYGKSPYIYPLYGLGELPQGFARLSAIYGGTYMLNTNIDEVKYGSDGKVSGIRATMKERGEEGEGMKFETKCSKILADPSYFPGKAQVVAHLVKAICILNHPIDKTDNADSLQLIIPQSQVGREAWYVHPQAHLHTSSNQLTFLPNRHLRSNGLLNPQRLPSRLLHSHRQHNLRSKQQPPLGTPTGPRPPRKNRRAIHGRAHPHLRTAGERGE